MTKAATCSAEGVKTFTCANDATHTKTEPIAIDPEAHAWGDWTFVDATNHSKVCANNSGHVVLEAHDWDDGVITKNPTSTETGIKTYTCSVCSGTKEEVIPVIPSEGRDVLWAGYAFDLDTVTVEGDKPAAADETIYVIAKAGACKIQIRDVAHTGTMTYHDNIGTEITRHTAVSDIIPVTYQDTACDLWIINRAMLTNDYIAVAKYDFNQPIDRIPDEKGYTFSVNVDPVYDTNVYSVKIDTINPALGIIVFDGRTKQTITVVTGVDVTKVQFVDQDTGATLTYNKTAAKSVVEDELNGTPVLVWTIERMFARREYKYTVNTRSILGLKDSGKTLNFTVGTAPNPVDSEVLIDAAAQGNDDGTATFTVKTAANVTKVKITNKTAGNTITIANPYTGSAQVDIATNGDGTLTWTITVNHTKGVTVDYDVQAFYVSQVSGGTYTTAKTVTVAMPDAGEEPAEPATAGLIEASAQGNANGTATFTVKTSADVTKVKFTNKTAGNTITISNPYTGSADVNIATNGDGTLTWTITINHTKNVTVNYDVQAFLGTGVYTAAQTVTVEMPAEQGA